jgi:hypothetical protein
VKNCGVDASFSGQEPVSDFCEHCKISSASVKGEEFIN